MKDYIQIIIVFFVFLTLIPAIALLNRSEHQKTALPAVSSESFEDIKSVKIYFTEEKKCKTYSLEEYMTGAVLAQMPADFESEALKAQAVLAHTYILKRSISEQNSPTDNLNGALISDNTELYQGFFTEEQAKKFYGDEYDSAYKKVKSAVEDVKNCILTYENQPIIVAFHAISSGFTESAETAWGEDLPYLQSVESPEDKEIDGVCVQTILSAEELQEKLSAVYDDIDFSSEKDKSDWIFCKSDKETGYVTSVDVCGKIITSAEFIEILDISSPCFTVQVSDSEFTFESMGYGHLVGMSQYGANSMAESGKNYSDILNRYFTGCKVISCADKK